MRPASTWGVRATLQVGKGFAVANGKDWERGAMEKIGSMEGKPALEVLIAECGVL